MENKNPRILKIITVDDSRIVAERLQCILSETENVKVLGNARSVSTALSLINKEEPNVVILDIHLEEDVHEGNGMNLLIITSQKVSGYENHHIYKSIRTSLSYYLPGKWSQLFFR